METIITNRFDKMLADERQRKARRQPHEEEHKLQCSCVKWFRLQYPKLSARLFAVPNGGRRDATTGAKLKAEGALAGVADLILLRSNNHYGALLIEMKTESRSSRQRSCQAEWQQAVCADGEYLYIICRTFDDFKNQVENYLSDN